MSAPIVQHRHLAVMWNSSQIMPDPYSSGAPSLRLEPSIAACNLPALCPIRIQPLRCKRAFQFAKVSSAIDIIKSALPYPISEHFLPNQASILTSFGKKCSFFNCEPCITGRSAQSLAAAHFAAEIKLQIAELWTTACKNDRRDRRYRLAGKPLQLLDGCGWDRQS